MAKESMKARERKRIALTEKYAEKRAELKKAACEGDWDAMIALQSYLKTLWKLEFIIDVI